MLVLKVGETVKYFKQRKKNNCLGINFWDMGYSKYAEKMFLILFLMRDI